MPVDWSAYPKNWKSEIVPRILRRDRYQCTTCQLPQYGVGVRLPDGSFLLSERGKTHAEGRAYVAALQDYFGVEAIVIVLAVSHECHDPKCSDERHLFSRCDYCHLRFDQEHHGKNTRKTLRRKREERATAFFL